MAGYWYGNNNSNMKHINEELEKGLTALLQLIEIELNIQDNG